MAPVNRALDQIHAGQALFRFALVVFIKQARVAADFPDPGQCRQNLYLLALDTFIVLSHNLIFQAGNFSVIELSLLLAHADIADFLQLVRQVLEDVFFQAAEDEGTDHLTEPVQAVLVVFLNDRTFKILLKFPVTL